MASEIRSEDRNSPHAQTRSQIRQSGSRRAAATRLRPPLLRRQPFPFRTPEKRPSAGGLLISARAAAQRRCWPACSSRGREKGGEGDLRRGGGPNRDPLLGSFIPQRCSGNGRPSSLRSGHQAERGGRGEGGAASAAAKVVRGSRDRSLRLFWGSVWGDLNVLAGLFWVPGERRASAAGGNRQRGCRRIASFPLSRELDPSRTASFSFSPGGREDSPRPSRHRFGFSSSPDFYLLNGELNPRPWEAGERPVKPRMP